MKRPPSELVKGRFDLFISHAASDRDLAESLREVVGAALNLDTRRIFVSSDGTSLRLREKSEPQITRAHQQAKAVIALMTPESIFRPWVIYEAGGANFTSAKPLLVLLARGATIDCLPAPLKNWQCGYLHDRKSLINLCENLGPIVGRSPQPVSNKKIEGLVALAGKSAGDWTAVTPSLVVEKADRSPFTLEHLLDDRHQSRCAKCDLYVAGQNLYYLTRSDNSQRMKNKIFGWLKMDRTRKFRILITDPGNKEAVAVWRSVGGQDFDRHLLHSVATFADWNADAKKRRLGFEARTTSGVPVTIMFVDPHDDAGFMVLTPIIYKPISGERPHFVIGRKQHRSIFDYYWYPYWEQISDKARII